jgi:hypothetical protein
MFPSKRGGGETERVGRTRRRERVNKQTYLLCFLKKKERGGEGREKKKKKKKKDTSLPIETDPGHFSPCS